MGRFVSFTHLLQAFLGRLSDGEGSVLRVASPCAEPAELVSDLVHFCVGYDRVPSRLLCKPWSASLSTLCGLTAD